MRLGAQLQQAIGQPAALARLGGIASRWSPLALSPLGYFDAEASSTLTLSGSNVITWADRVTAFAPTQATGGSRPVYSATSFNGRPGITFDGVDDYLRMTSAPYPANGDPCEIWVLASQDLPAGTTGVKTAAGYGASSGVQTRLVKRTVASGVNHAFAICGNSVGAAVSLTDTLLDYSGRHVQRAIFGPTTLGLEGDGLANTPVAMVPLTAADNMTLGASGFTTPSQFWTGVISAVLITNPLSATDAAMLLTYLKTRGGIA